MNNNDMWNSLPGINEMMADCEDPFIEALLEHPKTNKTKGMTDLFSSNDIDDEVHKLPLDEDPF